MTDIDNLLDATLDDLEDLPEFATLPAGAHSVLATLEIKEVNGKQAVELTIKLVEHLELANPAADGEGLPAGTISSSLFFLDNEYGRGKLKKLAKPLGEALGTGVLREIVEQTTDMSCAIITGVRKDKSDASKLYMDIKELIVQ